MADLGLITSPAARNEAASLTNPLPTKGWVRTAPRENRSARARAMRACGWVNRPGRWRSLVQPETDAAAAPVASAARRPPPYRLEGCRFPVRRRRLRPLHAFHRFQTD